MPPDPPSSLRVPVQRLFGRALRLRCPNCGSGGQFRSWFSMVERCGTCGLATDRIDGHWIGAVGINTIVTFGVIFFVLLGGFLVSYPDIAVLRISMIGLVASLLFPIAFFPLSKTLWTAIDLWMRPAERSELDPRHEP